MRHADTAMYVAKSSGRKNYQFFSAEMNVRATERLRLEAGAARARWSTASCGCSISRAPTSRPAR